VIFSIINFLERVRKIYSTHMFDIVLHTWIGVYCTVWDIHTSVSISISLSFLLLYLNNSFRILWSHRLYQAWMSHWRWGGWLECKCMQVSTNQWIFVSSHYSTSKSQSVSRRSVGFEYCTILYQYLYIRYCIILRYCKCSTVQYSVVLYNSKNEIKQDAAMY
jgi:hypothetical protein